MPQRPMAGPTELSYNKDAGPNQTQKGEFMKAINILVAVVMFTAVAGYAQSRNYESDAKAAIIAMNDQGDASVGPKIAEYLKANNVAIRTQTGDTASVTAVRSAGAAAIVLNDKAAAKASMRGMAVLVAQGAAELMYPTSGELVTAETVYMHAAMVAETYFEMHGERALLPDCGGFTDKKLAGYIRLWTENGAEQGIGVLREQGYKSVTDLQAQLTKEMAGKPSAEKAKQLQAISKKLASIAADFASFKNFERNWLASNSFMLK